MVTQAISLPNNLPTTYLEDMILNFKVEASPPTKKHLIAYLSWHSFAYT